MRMFSLPEPWSELDHHWKAGCESRAPGLFRHQNNTIVSMVGGLSTLFVARQARAAKW